ncbi:hypothetical protein [Methanobrevibacter sp.]|uniref:hypothetical protein n=1 Tax=Methanobrevibacter sp. TaxID=66852 RepID=UPI00261175B7|nr:hypothetical protein [uncultured Methanobrevibacter sp.]
MNILDKMLKNYPHFMDKSVGSNNYKVVSSFSKTIQSLKKDILKLQLSYILERPLKLWRVQSNPYEYSINFHVKIPDIKKISIYSQRNNEELITIYNEEFESGIDEFNDSILLNVNEDNEAVIPKTKFILEIIDFNDNHFLKGIPENDLIENNIFDHDNNLDNIGSNLGVNRRLLEIFNDPLEKDKFYNTIPTFFNQATESDYDYENRLKKIIQMRISEQFVQVELFEHFNVNSELKRKDRNEIEIIEEDNSELINPHDSNISLIFKLPSSKNNVRDFIFVIKDFPFKSIKNIRDDFKNLEFYSNSSCNLKDKLSHKIISKVGYNLLLLKIPYLKKDERFTVYSKISSTVNNGDSSLYLNRFDFTGHDETIYFVPDDINNLNGNHHFSNCIDLILKDNVKVTKITVRIVNTLNYPFSENVKIIFNNKEDFSSAESSQSEFAGKISHFFVFDVDISSNEVKKGIDVIFDNIDISLIDEMFLKLEYETEEYNNPYRLLDETNFTDNSKVIVNNASIRNSNNEPILEINSEGSSGFPIKNKDHQIYTIFRTSSFNNYFLSDYSNEMDIKLNNISLNNIEMNKEDLKYTLGKQGDLANRTILDNLGLNEWELVKLQSFEDFYFYNDKKYNGNYNKLGKYLQFLKTKYGHLDVALVLELANNVFCEFENKVISYLNLNPASNSTNFIIEDSTLYKTNNNNMIISPILVDFYNNPLANKNINIEIPLLDINLNLLTNSLGRVYLNLDENIADGTYYAIVTFSGDSIYSSVSKSFTINIESGNIASMYEILIDKDLIPANIKYVSENNIQKTINKIFPFCSLVDVIFYEKEEYISNNIEENSNNISIDKIKNSLLSFGVKYEEINFYLKEQTVKDYLSFNDTIYSRFNDNNNSLPLTSRLKQKIDGYFLIEIKIKDEDLILAYNKILNIISNDISFKITNGNLTYPLE